MKNPNWLDPLLYPFTYHHFQTQTGKKMHFVDEGEGDVILFIHGTPTWSFVWRQQIRALSRTHRCIAPDHIGFGLSDKPDENEFSYSLEAHSQNLEELVNYLGLKDITLVVHDFGGPIGLNYAQEHPENVKRIVILNTWMWSLEQESKMMKASEFLSGKVGRFLYLQLGFSVKFLLPKGYSKRKYLTKDVHQHYSKPLSSPTKRLGTWYFAKALSQSRSYYNTLWTNRHTLQDIPKMILWGEKDTLLPLYFRDKWQQAFPDAEVVSLNAGHFLQEEKGSEVADYIRDYITV